MGLRPPLFPLLEMEREGLWRRSNHCNSVQLLPVTSVCSCPQVLSAHFTGGGSRAPEAGQPILVTWAFLKVMPLQPCSMGWAWQAIEEQDTQPQPLQGLGAPCTMVQSWQSLATLPAPAQSDHVHLGGTGYAEHPAGGGDTGLPTACPILTGPSLTSRDCSPQVSCPWPFQSSRQWFLQRWGLISLLLLVTPICKYSLALLHSLIKYSYPSAS